MLMFSQYNIRKLYIIIFLTLVSLIVISWFRGNFLINHGDMSYPLLPIEDFKNFILFSWNHLGGMGFSMGAINNAFIYFLFPALAVKLGLSLILSEKILYFLIFFTAGASMYLLAESLAKDNRRLIALTASLAYLFSFYPIFTFWSNLISICFSYAATPLLLYLYIKLLTSEKIKYLFLWLLTTVVIFSPAAGNPGNLLVLILLHFIFAIYFFVFMADKNKWKTFLKINLLLISFWFVANSWWLLTSISNINLGLTVSGARTAEGSIGILEFLSRFTNFKNLFRFFGPWTFYDNLIGDPYYPWHNIYFTIPFILLSFIGPIIALLGIFSKKNSRYTNFFSLIFIIGLFLMKGVHEPFGAINRFITLKLPYMVVFRSSYEKFGVMTLIGYAVLVGFGFAAIFRFLKVKIKNQLVSLGILGFLGILMFGVYMWPYWTGDVIYAGGKIKPSARVKIPDYYYEAQQWLKNQPDEFKILSFPHQNGAAYKWESGYVGGDDPISHLWQKPIISFIDPKDNIFNPFVNELINSFEYVSQNPGSQLYMAGLTNIKYILLRKDVLYEINTPNPLLKAETIADILESNFKLQREQSFAKLDFYKIPDRYFLPLFFIPRQLIYINGQINNLFANRHILNDETRTAIYFDNSLETDKKFIFGESLEHISLDEITTLIDNYRGQLTLPIPLQDKSGVVNPKNQQSLSQLNINQRNYQLAIPKSGNYTLLLDSSSLPLSVLENLTVAFDDKTREFKNFISKDNNQKEIDIGFLEEGGKTIMLNFKSESNLLSSEDWQDQPAEKFGFPPSYQGFYKPINNWQPDAWYQIRALLPQSKNNLMLAVTEAMENGGDNKQETVWKLNPGLIYQLDNNGVLTLYLKSDQNSLKGSLLIIKENKAIPNLDTLLNNIQVMPIWEPEITLQLVNQTNNEQIKQTPRIAFSRINPAMYKVKVKGAKDPYVLVFNETFNRDWQLYVKQTQSSQPVGGQAKLESQNYDKIITAYFNEEVKEEEHQNKFFNSYIFDTWRQKPIAGNRHFLVNGYANSWQIKPEDVNNAQDYELIIEFTPQRLIYLGMFISGIAVIIIIVFLLYVILKKL